MAALNLDLDYFEHPKVMFLVAELGDWAEILPIRLWRFTAKYHAETGVIPANSMKFLEKHLNWRRKKGTGIEILVSAGFLEPRENGDHTVHDFLVHQGHIASFSARGRVAAAARWSRPRNGTDASSIPEAKPPDDVSNALTDITNVIKSPPQSASLFQGKGGPTREDGGSVAPTDLNDHPVVKLAKETWKRHGLDEHGR